MRNIRIQLWLALLAATGTIGGAVALAAEPVKAPAPAAPAAPSETSYSLTGGGTFVGVSGNDRAFREDRWQKNQWTGGIQEFLMEEKFSGDWKLTLQGRAIFDDEDYKVSLSIVNPKVGFLRAGFTEFRHYYNDTGGYFQGFNPSSFSLNQDLILRNGDIWVEMGLTMPDIPQLTLGYERQYRQGEKSLLEWGAVTQGSTTRNIYPSWEGIDEHVDIFKVQIEHDLKNVHLANQFRFEHYANDNTRYDHSVNLNTGASQSVTINETYSHDEFFNTFRADSHLNEKVYWSLGYMYSTLNGNAGLNVMTPPPLGPFDKNWVANNIALDVDSHVVNLNTMFGPFAGLSIYLGLQGELTDTTGFTNALLTEGNQAPTTNVLHSDDDKKSIEETFGLRYTKIPLTTLYAEGHWTEQDINLSESETEDGSPTAGQAFNRVTDTSIFRQDYRIGFNTAPLPRITLSSRYRHSIYDNDYAQDLDTAPGYPAFITAQDFTTDEIMARLTWRACSKVTVAFTYQLVSTQTKTTTDSVALLAPGGSLYSGDYNSSIYTVSTTLTPMSRMYLSGLFSYQDTQTTVTSNGDPSLTKYVGTVYTVISTAGLALDAKTDATVEYSYSRSDNFTNNSSSGLPLGLDFQRTGVVAGLARRIRENIIARLRYGYYEYYEPSNGGINNYTANLVSASCSIRF